MIVRVEMININFNSKYFLRSTNFRVNEHFEMTSSQQEEVFYTRLGRCIVKGGQKKNCVTSFMNDPLLSWSVSHNWSELLLNMISAIQGQVITQNPRSIMENQNVINLFEFSLSSQEESQGFNLLITASFLQLIRQGRNLDRELYF